MFGKEPHFNEPVTNDEFARKRQVSRRSFFQKGIFTGLKVAAGLFAFIPAVQVLAKETSSHPISESPDYTPCQNVYCNNCNGDCDFPFYHFSCYDSRSGEFCFCSNSGTQC